MTETVCSISRADDGLGTATTIPTVTTISIGPDTAPESCPFETMAFEDFDTEAKRLWEHLGAALPGGTVDALLRRMLRDRMPQLALENFDALGALLGVLHEPSRETAPVLPSTH